VTARGRDALALGALLAPAAVLFSRGLGDRTNYDEGVYLASLDALRHGQELGRDVFASQPPGFYLLLRALGLVAGRSVDGLRIGMIVIAVLGVVAAYVIGRRLAGTAGGLAAGALVIAAPPYAAQAPRVTADLPAVALALAALAIAACSFGRGAVWAHAAAGAVAVAAISVKLLALPVLVPLVVLAWQRRVAPRAAAAALLGGLAVALVLIGVYADVLPELWHDAVGFHRDARSISFGQSAGSRVVDYFGGHTPTTWVAAAGLVAAVLVRRHVALWAWVAAAIVFLVLQVPLLDHHFVLLAAALATAAGASLTSVPGRARIVALGIVFLGAAAGWVQDYRQIDRSSEAEPAEVRRAAAAVRALTRPGELVASDLPIVAYLADRREPGDLVDTSAVRFATGSLTPRDVDRAPVRVYVAGREFARHPATTKNLSPLRRFGPITILVRRRAAPP
jgi:4-amino-4-deoxy-L-arabinose transferase-like glycosyltransferase